MMHFPQIQGGQPTVVFLPQFAGEEQPLSVRIEILAARSRIKTRGGDLHKSRERSFNQRLMEVQILDYVFLNTIACQEPFSHGGHRNQSKRSQPQMFNFV